MLFPDVTSGCFRRNVRLDEGYAALIVSKGLSSAFLNSKNRRIPQREA